MQRSGSPAAPAGFRPGLSIMSLTSRGGGSVCSSMCSSPRSRYVPDECTPRRFSSRHVPKVAEELAQRSEHLSPSAASQFNGLMKYLKPNSESEEQQKQALASDIEVLVPEDLFEALQGEFERRCAYGERLNTELMSSAKWIKVLKDIGAVAAPGDGGATKTKGRGSVGGQGRRLAYADADIVYHKVLHNCDHGGKRLTFDVFCKALYLVGQATRPDLDGEAALADVVARVVAAAPQEAQEEDWSESLVDPNVVMVLDQFKPALHDLHTTFCRHGLENPAEACRGRGTVRLRERSFWMTTQGSQGLSGFTGATGVSRASRLSLQGSSPASSPTPAQDEAGGAAGGAKSSPFEGFGPKTVKGLAEVSAGAGGDSPACGAFGMLPTLLEGGSSKGSPKHGGAQSPSATVLSELWGETVVSRASAAPSDPYTYVNGAPVIRNRQKMMSLDQWLTLNRQFDVMPERMSRHECVNIFKRAQLSGQASSHGGSMYGYLNQEAFVEAVGVLALQAYAKEPYCEEFPAPHERIHAFLLRILPSSSKVLHERFGGQRMAMPGCAVAPTFMRPM